MMILVTGGAYGTGVRNYIYIEDLAAANKAALYYLESGSKSRTLTVGHGKGISVEEVITIVHAVIGVIIILKKASYRSGDLTTFLANADFIREALAGKPGYDDLRTIMRMPGDGSSAGPQAETNRATYA